MASSNLLFTESASMISLSLMFAPPTTTLSLPAGSAFDLAGALRQERARRGQVPRALPAPFRLPQQGERGRPRPLRHPSGPAPPAARGAPRSCCRERAAVIPYHRRKRRQKWRRRRRRREPRRRPCGHSIQHRRPAPGPGVRRRAGVRVHRSGGALGGGRGGRGARPDPGGAAAGLAHAADREAAGDGGRRPPLRAARARAHRHRLVGAAGQGGGGPPGAGGHRRGRGGGGGHAGEGLASPRLPRVLVRHRDARQPRALGPSQVQVGVGVGCFFLVLRAFVCWLCSGSFFCSAGCRLYFVSGNSAETDRTRGRRARISCPFFNSLRAATILRVGCWLFSLAPTPTAI